MHSLINGNNVNEMVYRKPWTSLKGLSIKMQLLNPNLGFGRIKNALFNLELNFVNSMDIIYRRKVWTNQTYDYKRIVFNTGSIARAILRKPRSVGWEPSTVHS